MFLGSRRERVEESLAAAPADLGSVFPTKALKAFLGTLASRESPVLLDLGPVVGPNVAFFGERLGCTLFVEDLFGDLSRHAEQGKLESFAEFLAHRLTHLDDSVDGVLCWNLLDYLDVKTGQVLADELTRVLRSDGALLGFFSAVSTPDNRFTKYVIVDDEPAPPAVVGGVGQRRSAPQPRYHPALQRPSCRRSFLLKTNVREFCSATP